MPVGNSFKEIVMSQVTAKSSRPAVRIAMRPALRAVLLLAGFAAGAAQAGMGPCAGGGMPMAAPGTCGQMVMVRPVPVMSAMPAMPAMPAGMAAGACPTAATPSQGESGACPLSKEESATALAEMAAGGIHVAAAVMRALADEAGKYLAQRPAATGGVAQPASVEQPKAAKP